MRRPALIVLILALVGIQPLLTPPASAQTATPAAACAATSADENKDAVNQFLAAVTSGDVDAAAALTADGITYHSRQG